MQSMYNAIREVIKMLISIIGKSGSGKSFFSKKLAAYNKKIIHIDVDKISHKILTYSEIKKKLVEEFGQEVVRANEVQRKILGEKVFSSESSMNKLTEITWPIMEKEIDEIIENNQDRIIILDWLLIPKTKYFEKSDLKILITAPLKQRMKLVTKRDNVSNDYFNKREKAGIEFNEKDYDVVIQNISEEQIIKEAREIYEKSIISGEF